MSEELNLVKPRRRNTKERIIDEAESLAALHGIEHLKLQDVADRIGIKLPSVYAHFSGREDILAAMGSRISRGIGQLYIAQPGEAPIVTIKRSAQEFLQFLAGRPAYFRLMLRDHSVPLGYDPLNHRTAVNHKSTLPPDLRDMVTRLQSLIDKISKESNPMAAEDFACCVHGYLLIRLSWLPTTTNGEGLVLVDHAPLQSALDQIINRLLGI